MVGDRGIAFRPAFAGNSRIEKSGGPEMRKPAKQSLSRRKALAVGAGAVAAGAVAAPIFGLVRKTAAPETGLLSWWPQRDANLAVAGRNEWSSYVGKDFAIQTERGTGTARLLEIQSLPSKGDRPPEVSRESAFALVFSIPSGAKPVGDRIYKVTPAGARETLMYFSPAATKLLAVFN
jgi:hypothetical protein